MLFVLLYVPGHLCDLLRTGQGFYRTADQFAFNLSISCAIVFVTMSILRLLFLVFRKKLASSILIYSIWCLIEMVVTATFLAMYFSLMAGRDPSSGNFFWFLGNTVGAYLPMALIPYVLMTLIYMLSDSYSTQPLPDDSRIRFYDNRHLLKFATSVSSVLYIEAEENYVSIHYLDNGVTKRTQIRATMKSVEAMCETTGYVRVHRSYIVNPKHVSQLTKDPDGFFFAVIDSDSTQIPVSKKYQKSLESIV